jgi:hypothetical protein
MSFQVKVGDRSANKPIYLVEVQIDKTKLYYKTTDLFESASYIEIRGYQLDKTEAEKLEKEPYEEITGSKTEINIKIPWSKINIVKSVTYKIAKKE